MSINCKFFSAGVCLLTMGGCYPEGCPHCTPDLTKADVFPKVKLPAAPSWCTSEGEPVSAHLKIELIAGEWQAQWVAEVATTNGLGTIIVASSPVFKDKDIENVLHKAYEWAKYSQSQEHTQLEAT